MSQPKLWSAHWKALRLAFAATLPQPCGKCGRTINPGDDWHLSHKLARSKGGLNTPDNLEPQHARCNMAEAPRLRWEAKVLRRTAAPSRRW